jgi:hypothetical protein
VRRSIARIYTVMRERELGISYVPVDAPSGGPVDAPAEALAETAAAVTPEPAAADAPESGE